MALLSIGIPVIVTLAAEALGQYLAALTRENEVRVQEWEEAMAAWHRRLQASWAAQQRRAKARADRAVPEPARPMVASSERPLVGQPTPIGSLPRWLSTHLATIGRRVGDRDGNGSFQRKDVEAWLNISSSQANNILRLGKEHGYVTRLPGYRYQLTSFAEAALSSAETKPRMEEVA